MENRRDKRYAFLASHFGRSTKKMKTTTQAALISAGAVFIPAIALMLFLESNVDFNWKLGLAFNLFCIAAATVLYKVVLHRLELNKKEN